MILYYGGEDYKEYDREGVIWVDSLNEILFETDIEILVLFSEPTPEDLPFIQKMDMSKVFAHDGIHLSCTKFRTKQTLNQLIASAQDEKSNLNKKQYFETLKEMDEEEREYLCNRYQLNLPYPSKNEPLKNELRNYSGKLITYRGGNHLFKTIVNSIAKKNRKHQILLMDGDLLKPSFDEIFRIKNISTKESGYITGRDNTGLNIALDLLNRKSSIDDILRKTTIKNFGFYLRKLTGSLFRRGGISMMLGNYNIYNYENYNLSLLQTLISAMLQRFDFVIVKLSDELHDEFAMSMVHRGDFNIIAVQNYKSEIRYYAQVYEMLVVRQNIDKNKICVVKGYSFPDGVFPYLFKSSYRGNAKHIASILRRL